MKILYDYQTFQMQKFGGISRYFYKLIKYNNDLWDFYVSGKYADNIYVEEISTMKNFPIKPYFKGKPRLINCINQMHLLGDIKNGYFDVYHPTYYDAGILASKKPIVITAHDFIHELFLNELRVDKEMINSKKRILERADRIIAISQNTKNDLLKFYPNVNEEKIDVIYHAIEWDKREIKFNKELRDKKYILFTGNRESYKNFNFFVKSISSLLLKYDINLVCTGKPFTKDELALLQKLCILDRVKIIFASEETLRSLYENAICFCFPSVYEGFGLPILESWVSGCPCLLANSSCFPEIAQDAALYFDPENEDSLRDVLEKLVLSETIRNDLIQKGFSRFDLFSMNNMINSTRETYYKAMGN